MKRKKKETLVGGLQALCRTYGIPTAAFIYAGLHPDGSGHIRAGIKIINSVKPIAEADADAVSDKLMHTFMDFLVSEGIIERRGG